LRTTTYVPCHKMDNEMTNTSVCAGCLNPCSTYLNSLTRKEKAMRKNTFYSHAFIDGFESFTLEIGDKKPGEKTRTWVDPYTGRRIEYRPMMG